MVWLFLLVFGTLLYYFHFQLRLIFLPGWPGPPAESTGSWWTWPRAVLTEQCRSWTTTPTNWSLSTYLVMKRYILIFFVDIRHKLSPADVPRRLAMCESIIQKNANDPSWLPKLWTSDEANFNLNGKICIFKANWNGNVILGLVNSKNVLCYSPRGQGRPENFSIETVKHPDGVMVHPTPPLPCYLGVFVTFPYF